jgi:hypothetical protein
MADPVEPQSGSEGLELQQLREAKARYEDDLLGRAGVHGLGIGYKVVAGQETDQLAIVVLVDRKLSPPELDARQAIPPQLSFTSSTSERVIAVPTDVQVAARPVPAPHVSAPQLRMKVRPAPGGVMIASPTGSGTLGGWAIDQTTGAWVFLSNRHVLGFTPGDIVMQPLFPLPGDTTDYRFGRVLRASATFDATIGEPLDRADVDPEIFGNGPAIYEIAPATLGMMVEKTGVSTGHTEGRVDLIDVTTTSPCQRSRTAFRVTSTSSAVFVQQGDSGSIIVERSHPDGMNWKRVVGLLYCATTNGLSAHGHQMTDVFTDLGLKTACTALAGVVDGLFASVTAPGVSATEGFGRDVADRLTASDSGREMVEMLSAHRASAVRLILDGDGHRAVQAALAPLLTGAVVTDDLLDRVITDDDAERVGRVLDIADRLASADAAPALRQAREALNRARNQPLRTVLLDRPERPV